VDVAGQHADQALAHPEAVEGAMNMSRMTGSLMR
jgi:hypothetical protein